MTDLLKAMQDQDVERELYGKHPLLKKGCDRNVRDAYLFALFLAAVADNGKVEERERWALRRVGAGLCIIRSEVEEICEEVSRFSEEKQLQLLDEVAVTLSGHVDCLEFLLIEFSKIWMCGTGRISDVDEWRKLISTKCGCDYDASQFKEGDDVVWNYADLMSMKILPVAQISQYFKLFDAKKLPCLRGSLPIEEVPSAVMTEIDVNDVESQYKALRKIVDSQWPTGGFLLKSDFYEMREDVGNCGIHFIKYETIVPYLENLWFLRFRIFSWKDCEVKYIRILILLCAYKGMGETDEDILLLNVLNDSNVLSYGYTQLEALAHQFEALAYLLCGTISRGGVNYTDGWLKDFRREAKKKSYLRQMQAEMERRKLEVSK